MILPVLLGIKPWEGTFEGRVIPAPGQPGGMMHHAQRSKRFNQYQFPAIEIVKLAVCSQQRIQCRHHLTAIS